MDPCSHQILDPNLQVLVERSKAEVQEQQTVMLKFIALVTFLEEPYIVMNGTGVLLVPPLKHLLPFTEDKLMKVESLQFKTVPIKFPKQRDQC